MTTNQNKLINEKSPYLLQHAHNPVNWYPWGEEAFEKAKQENKPIFLSIGYSTCHLSHVFARESFEDKKIADYLNKHYVSIKVDREERPDIDSVYMKVCKLMTGQNGWPLSIFMTSDKIPYYAGTYFPRKSKRYIPGFMDVLTQLNQEFKEDQDHVQKVTSGVTEALTKMEFSKGQNKLSSKYTIQTYQLLEQRFDSTDGGFGVAPKFPAPQNIYFLMRFHHFLGKKDALKMAEHTLKAMANGGIYDHVGFGFSRYSTDAKWLVPHFEKMLNDNALLLIAYTECYQITKNPFYKKISEQIIVFIMREMHSSDGAFYSAIDAESEGVEGNYYVWDYDEVLAILGDEIGAIYTTAYDITPNGNFKGKNIPNLVHANLKAVAEEFNLTIEKLHHLLDEAREKLLVAREKRVYPHVDDKILTSWNAMMITALAKAGNVFQEPEYTKTAEDALTFIETNLIQKGRLMARYRDGEVKFNGYLNDYAFLLWAYTELYNTTLSLSYLKKARELADNMLELFWDKAEGGFFLSGHDSEKLLSREKEIYDDALPSGNSIAATTLAQLGYLTGETRYLDKVEEMYYTFYKNVRQDVPGTTSFMQSLLLTEIKTKEVVILGSAEGLVKELQQEFSPDISLLISETPEQLADIAPNASAYKKLANASTFYVCENFKCHKPTIDVDVVRKLIR